MIMGESIIEGVVASSGERLDKALAAASGLSRERVKALLGEGRITLGGSAAGQASLKLAAGTAFRISVPEAVPAEADMLEVLVWWPDGMGPFKARPPRSDKPRFSKPDAAKAEHGKPHKRFDKNERKPEPPSCSMSMGASPPMAATDHDASRNSRPVLIR